MKNKELETNLKHYLALNYPMTLIKDEEEGLFFIEFPDLPGCLAHGKTPASAVKLAEEVKGEWIKDALEKGHSVPEPKKEDEYSGKFVVRIPRALHRRLSIQAEREGRSLNQHVGILLSERSAALEVERQLNRFAALQEGLKKNIEALGIIQKSITYSARYSVLGGQTPPEMTGIFKSLASTHSQSVVMATGIFRGKN